MKSAPPQGSRLLEPGISLHLAKWRSRYYRNVRYRVDAVVSPAIDALCGTVDIVLTLAKRVPVILDWRGGTPTLVESVNDVAARTIRCESEHIVVPTPHLRVGENHLRIRFTSPIAVSGAGVTRFRDFDDTNDYIYSLLVPADASTVFPCFDQPDLKGRFTLRLDVSATWQIIANAPVESERINGSRKIVAFEETEPISTYLFAFAAGPFTVLTCGEGDPTRLFVRRSRSAAAREQVSEVLRLNRAAIRYFESYFNHEFPFAKYDLVLIPEFAYNGMEHAGATFLSEDAVLLTSAPSAVERLQRANLIFHETAHQWMGNLVTMRWFDDLWLKEGFANLMAAKAAAVIVPELDPWVAFLALKTNAYRTDATPGTTPLRQPLPNLAAAKSNYGSIVYSKAPAVLRQAEFALGEHCFQQAIRRFVQRHAYGAANWKDLVRALEESSGENLTRWAAAWINRAGMARVSAHWSSAADFGFTSLVIHQSDSSGGPGVWPQRVRMLLGDDAGGAQCVDVTLAKTRTRMDSLPNFKTPAYVLPNDADTGYGLFILDARSREYLRNTMPGIHNPLRRALIWNAMWDSVREGEFAPSEFLRFAADGLAHEQSEMSLGALLANMQVAFRWYLTVERQTALAPILERALMKHIDTTPTLGHRIAIVRTLAAIAMSDCGLTYLKATLNRTIPDVSLRDRHRIVQRLIAVSDPQANAYFEAIDNETDRDAGRRYAFGSTCTRRDQKAVCFKAFLDDKTLPEAWIEEALGPFNMPEHADATIDFLPKALQALPHLKQERKIFFVNRWLDAFVRGQHSKAALDEIQRFLQTHTTLDLDLRRKVQEAAGELARTVAIRERYAQ